MFYTAIPLLLAVGVLLVAPSAARAQTPPTCMTLLTADELTKAVSAGFADMGGRERGEGETECPWMLRGGSAGFKTVSVQFYDLRAVKASQNAPTLDAFFEQIVAAAKARPRVKSARRWPAWARRRSSWPPTRRCWRWCSAPTAWRASWATTSPRCRSRRWRARWLHREGAPRDLADLEIPARRDRAAHRAGAPQRRVVIPTGPTTGAQRTQVKASVWAAHLGRFLDSLPALPPLTPGTFVAGH